MYLKNVKEFVKEWKEELKQKVEGNPTVGIVQVGENPASTRYVRNKIKDCEEIGIDAKLLSLPEEVTEEEFLRQFLPFRSTVNSIIIQLPLPPQLDINKLKMLIPDDMDVDGFSPTSPFDPCTPAGIMKYLDYCGFDLDGKNVVIAGRSEIVGRPLAKMMIDRNATVTLCHSHTKNICTFYRTADLIVTAVGKPNFLNCYPIHVPVIDVGINFVDGKMVGDCINTENRDVTPVPGGVGLLTRCALLENVIIANRYPKSKIDLVGILPRAKRFIKKK